MRARLLWSAGKLVPAALLGAVLLWNAEAAQREQGRRLDLLSSELRDLENALRARPESSAPARPPAGAVDPRAALLLADAVAQGVAARLQSQAAPALPAVQPEPAEQKPGRPAELSTVQRQALEQASSLVDSALGARRLTADDARKLRQLRMQLGGGGPELQELTLRMIVAINRGELAPPAEQGLFPP